jgi:enamine deaminase RidA (YjgF/YER057c/UK114 family)
MLSPVNPETLGAPKGYSNGMLTPAGARILFVAGQIGWDAQGNFVGDDFADQFGKALENVLEVVRAAGGGPESIARLTIYVVDKVEYAAATRRVGEHYRALMGRHFPAMALLEVKSLLEPLAKVEIEATAAV